MADFGIDPNDTSADAEAVEDAPVRREVRPSPFERLAKPKEVWAEQKSHDYERIQSGATGDWGFNNAVYEWDGEEGDIGPEHKDLEELLFGVPVEQNPMGVDMSVVNEIGVIQEGQQRVHPITNFKDAGLHPAMLKNVELAGYTNPTPIQRYCVPAIKMGHDLIAIAQTGSGKTAAYLVPILNHLMGKAKRMAAPRPDPAAIKAGTAPHVRAEPLVVIVVPARELAIQIFNDSRKFCYRSMLRPCAAYGGGPLRDQIAQLQQGCDVLVATPGRLVDLMDRPEVLTLRRLKYLVIDEADEMLHDDWDEELNKIMGGGEQEEGNVKYMLFSATFPVALRKLARNHLSETHMRIHVGRIGSTHSNIAQDVVWVDPPVKKQALLDLLYSFKPLRTIIFVNNKRVADELDDFLYHKNMPCTSMHSDRTQREREDAVRAFRSGTTPIMITTGVMARGMDVHNVGYVVNYDLPSMDHGGIAEYTHRIGRTGRMGGKGRAVSFYTERDEPLAPLLAMTLLETRQEVPDFLQGFLPPEEERANLKFEPDSDEYEEEEKNGGGDDFAWSAADDTGGNAGTNTGTGAGAGWGSGGDAPPENEAAPASGADAGFGSSGDFGSGGGFDAGAGGNSWAGNDGENVW